VDGDIPVRVEGLEIVAALPENIEGREGGEGGPDSTI